MWSVTLESMIYAFRGIVPGAVDDMEQHLLLFVAEEQYLEVLLRESRGVLKIQVTIPQKLNQKKLS